MLTLNSQRLAATLILFYHYDIVHVLSYYKLSLFLQINIFITKISVTKLLKCSEINVKKKISVSNIYPICPNAKMSKKIT